MIKYNLKHLLMASSILFTACQNYQKVEETKQKAETLFGKGNKNTTDNFKGDVWVESLIEADSLNTIAVGNVTFAPGARSNWHTHPAGQILLVTDGVGYYQEKGQPKKILRKGDKIRCLPNIEHWHGASIDSSFVQLAITSRQFGPTVWLKPVTDKEYNSTAVK